MWQLHSRGTSWPEVQGQFYTLRCSKKGELEMGMGLAEVETEKERENESKSKAEGDLVRVLYGK